MTARASAISVENVWKTFRVFQQQNTTLKQALLRRNREHFEQFWALEDVSFEVPESATFGIIGSNGAGKSTMLKTLSRILVPDRGQVTVKGKVSALLELGAGFHPELSGRENIYLNGNILGLSNRDIDARFDEIVDFSGLGSFIEQPVKTYSSGMYARLGFSVAVSVEPDILLIDEVLSVGDEEFQRRSSERMEQLRVDGRTVVFVSHGLAQVQQICEQAVWLDHGKVRASGETGDVVDAYLESVGAAFRLDDQGRQRTGSGDIEVDVELEHDARQIRTGDRLSIRITWTSDRHIENAAFGLTIRNDDGTVLGSVSTSDGGPMTVRRGTGELDYVIGSLPLLPGRYHVAIAVMDHEEGHVYDHSPTITSFDVVAVGRGRGENGLVALGGRWGAG